MAFLFSLGLGLAEGRVFYCKDPTDHLSVRILQISTVKTMGPLYGHENRNPSIPTIYHILARADFSTPTQTKKKRVKAPIGTLEHAIVLASAMLWALEPEYRILLFTWSLGPLTVLAVPGVQGISYWLRCAFTFFKGHLKYGPLSCVWFAMVL